MFNDEPKSNVSFLGFQGHPSYKRIVILQANCDITIQCLLRFVPLFSLRLCKNNSRKCQKIAFSSLTLYSRSVILSMLPAGKGYTFPLCSILPAGKRYSLNFTISKTHFASFFDFLFSSESRYIAILRKGFGPCFCRCAAAFFTLSHVGTK